MKQKQPHRHKGHLDSQAGERIGGGIKREFRVISCILVLHDGLAMRSYGISPRSYIQYWCYMMD